MDTTLVEDRVIAQIQAALPQSPEYVGVVAERFDWLAFALVRFVSLCIDAPKSVTPYLSPWKAGDAKPVEADLQNDMYRFLKGLGTVDIEKRGVASGRSDLVLPMNGFQFVIEVKCTEDEWKSAIAGFLGQTTAYQQADVKLGVLAVLDLTKRDAGVPGLEYCFEVHERQIPGEKGRHALVVRVPANRTAPSDMSR